MNKNIIIVLALVLIAAGAWFFGFPQKSTEMERTVLEETTPSPASEIPTPTDSATAPVAPVVTTFSMTEVASHNTPENCYTAVRGDVYNLTAWITAHPGGEKAILKLCGIDGTAAFEGKHGGQPKQEETLESFKIGKLAE